MEAVDLVVLVQVFEETFLVPCRHFNDVCGGEEGQPGNHEQWAQH